MSGALCNNYCNSCCHQSYWFALLWMTVTICCALCIFSYTILRSARFMTRNNIRAYMDNKIVWQEQQNLWNLKTLAVPTFLWLFTYKTIHTVSQPSFRIWIILHFIHLLLCQYIRNNLFHLFIWQNGKTVQWPHCFPDDHCFHKELRKKLLFFPSKLFL